MVDIPDPFGAKPGAAQSLDGSPIGNAFDWLEGFGKSAVESIPELIGITPSTETQQFRQDNPVSGFVSELAGTAVPYMGWFKAAKAVGPLARAVEGIGDIVNKPFTTGALRNAALFAPFEAARVGVSQIPGVGDKDLSSMVGDATLNLALGSGIAGLLHGVASAGLRDPSVRTMFPDLDLAAPLPLQARQMRQIIDSGVFNEDPEALGRANAKLSDTLRLARTEELPSTQKYVGPIAHDATPDANTTELERQLDRLFRVRENPEERVIQTRKFAQGAEKDFPDQNSWTQAAEAAGLPQNFEEHGQFFRQISFDPKATSSPKVAQVIDNRLTRNMEKVSDNDFITREADDGMFVIARKVAGEPGKPAPEDQWVLFKTDQPGYFLPEADKWAKYQVALGKWTPGADLAKDGGEVYNSMKNFTEQFPLRNYMGMARDPEGVGAVIDKILPANVRGPQNEVVNRLGEAIKEYLAPRVYQFKKSWRANWVVNATKVGYDAAENFAQEIMNGVVKVDPGKNLFFQGLKNDKSPALGFQPVRDLVDAIPEKDFEQFWNVWRKATPVEALPELMTKGEISPEVLSLAQELQKIDLWNRGNINKTEAAVGKNPTSWMEGHYGLSRQWEGDTRVILRDPANNVVALAGGPNRRAAQAQANAILKENPDWRMDGEFSLSHGVIPQDLDPKIRNPSWMLERQDVRGFQFDTRAFSKNEFLDAFENNLRSRMKYQANLSANDMLQPQLAKLEREDASAFRMATARMNDYAGLQSAFGKWQNKVTDQILGPMLGTNSASKIVQITNTSLFNLQLGALKLSYPVINALQFVQTVLPEAAFVMGKAPPEALAGKYSFFAAGGTKGPVGGIGVLSPLKMMAQSFKEMAAPSAELSEAFERAVNDRVIDPRLVENYIGESRTRIHEVGKALTSGKGFVDWLRSVSEWLPAETERISRSHAFTTGYILARDLLKREGQELSKDQLYSFARQFTENTMYLYGATDKPRIFTTPAGSLMGLFKNWMFNFMAQMGEYTHEGFAHNNWAPLMWQTTGTFALGGLAATPMWWAADSFSRMWSNKSAMEMAYEQFGQGGDAVLLGLPAALTGISLYSGVNSPLSNPTRDAASLFSIAAWDRVKSVGKAAGAAFDNWQATGEHPAHNQGVRELMMRAFAPTTLYRTMGAMTPEQITQMGTGYPLVKDVPPMHRALYSFGFNPTELDRGQMISDELYSRREKMNAQVKKLSDAWADAEIAGHSEQMGTIMRQAMVWGVDVSAVIKGGMNNLKKSREDMVERALRPKDIQAVFNALQVQRGGGN